MALLNDQPSPHQQTQNGFLELFSTHRKLILILLILGFGWRVFLVIKFPHEAGDEIRYTAPATNMLMGRGFSADTAAPYLPGEHTMPFYPIFIATIYGIAGQNNPGVRIAQAFVDTATCLLVSFLSFSLAPIALRRYAALSSLVICTFLSWFTVFWTRYILTETLAIFLTTAVVALSVWALRGSNLRWLLVGAVCAVAILTRADSILLACAGASFLVVEIVRKRSPQTILGLILFCAAIPLVLAPWTIRNYLAFGKFQPLHNPYGKPRGEYVPTGYLLWTRTWLTDETNYHVTDLLFHPGDRDFDPRLLPDYVFDSQSEKDQVVGLIDQYNESGNMSPDLNDKFRALAEDRIKRNPLRFYLELPLKRVVSMWLTGFVTSNRLHMYVRILSVLPILIGGVMGFALWARNTAVVSLMLLVIVTRTTVFGFVGGEARYMVELYPLMIAACGLTVAGLYGRLRRPSSPDSSPAT